MPPTDQTPEGAPSRPGLPSANTILSESVLIPPQPATMATTAPRGAAAAMTYRILRTNQVDGYEPQPRSDAEVLAAPQAMAAAGDNFKGSDRKVAKLSIASGATQAFSDIKDLVAALPKEQAMTAHNPQITRDPAFDRVIEEKRNVSTTAWIYAASRENDNDFHLIVGRDPKKAPATYMTMEISGLPPANAASHATIKKVRDTYKGFFTSLPGTGYDFYDPPVPVEIGGSLFFDITHATGGRPGPKDLRSDMPVIWEVHPVTHLVFEP
jgi:hypothetical protein